MSQIKLIAGACVALLAAFLIGWGVWSAKTINGLRDDLRASQAEVASLQDARERDASADKVKVKAVKAAQEEYNERKVTLDEAYEANREWADSPVPPAVLDGLY